MRGWWALVIVLAGGAVAPAQYQSLYSARQVNRRIAGQVIDYTRNGLGDRRLWSPVLGQHRDLYVYLPPGYDPANAYPLVLWLHGSFGDEHGFLGTARLECLDQLIRTGAVPPLILAAPDGTCNGLNLITSGHSFFIDSGCGGAFETHVVAEVIPFLMTRYSVRPERQAHAIIGLSAGGFGAMGLAIKHRCYFGSAVSVAGAINLRYWNVRGDYQADFSPATYRWNNRYDPHLVVGSYAAGLVRLQAQDFLTSAFGRGPEVVAAVQRNNPADLLFTTGLAPGELAMLVTFGRRDQLNMDAQAESFVWLASTRGVSVDVMIDPEGGHTPRFFEQMMPSVYVWLAHGLLPPVRADR